MKFLILTSVLKMPIKKNEPNLSEMNWLCHLSTSGWAHGLHFPWDIGRRNYVVCQMDNLHIIEMLQKGTVSPRNKHAALLCFQSREANSVAHFLAAQGASPNPTLEPSFIFSKVHIYKKNRYQPFFFGHFTVQTYSPSCCRWLANI